MCKSIFLMFLFDSFGFVSTVKGGEAETRRGTFFFLMSSLVKRPIRGQRFQYVKYWEG
jgi:hypothetical protein